MTPATRACAIPEVVSVICECIAENALSKSEVSAQCTTGVPVGRREWRGALANLIVVDKAFHDAYVPHLWGTLHGLVPLLLLLGAEKVLNRDGPPTLRLQADSIAKKPWRRFRHYSSYVRSLILGPRDQEPLDPSSMAYFSFGLAKAQAGVFENLELVHLNSDDGFSVYLATALLCEGKKLHLELGPLLHHTDAAILYASCGSLTSLRIDHVVSSRPLLAVATLFKLQSLSLTIHGSATATLVDSIAGLHYLKELTISQSALKPEAGSHPSSTDGGPDRVTTLQRLNLPHLRSLSIDGHLTMQTRFKPVLKSITSLENLRLIIAPKKLAILIPSLIEHYASRNPGLLSLNVKVTAQAQATPAERLEEHRRSDEGKLNKFLLSLSSLTSLRHFCVVNVPFFDTTIIGRVVEALESLHKLRTFQFLPVPVTSALGDTLLPGDLPLLDQLAQGCAELRYLETSIHVGGAPIAEPRKWLVEHPLEKILILPNGQPPVPFVDKIRVAAFIEVTFPRLKEVSVPTQHSENEAGSELWSNIQDLVTVRQNVRAEVLRKAKSSCTLLSCEEVNELALGPGRKEGVSSSGIPEIAVLAEPYDSDDSGVVPGEEREEQIDELEDDAPKQVAKPGKRRKDPGETRKGSTKKMKT